MHRGRVDAQNLCCLANRHKFPGGRFRRWLETRDTVIAAETADLIGREAFPSGGFASLTIQDSGDDVIGIKSAKRPSSESLSSVGANPTRLRRRQVEIEFRECA